MVIWTYFRLPECKGRTYRELDILFERRVPAKKFVATQVDMGATDRIIDGWGSESGRVTQ